MRVLEKHLYLFLFTFLKYILLQINNKGFLIFQPYVNILNSGYSGLQKRKKDGYSDVVFWNKFCYF